MRIFKAALTVLFVSLMASCSSDDATTPVNNIPVGPEATYFNYKLDGVTIPMIAYSGIISENEVRVTASSASGQGFIITFTTFGNIAEVAAIPASGSASPKWNFKHFRKNYFDFELVSIANGQAKVNFSGKVYENDYDLQSDFSTVEGDFVVNLQTQAPILAGQGVSAVVNGNAWHKVSGSQSSGSDGFSLNYDSDDEYGIIFFINPNTLAVGNYTFNAASPNVNKVIVSKYNEQLEYGEELVSTSGTFNITSKTVSGPYTIIEGTFTVTATHPDANEVVTITNGIFKTAYDF